MSDNLLDKTKNKMSNNYLVVVIVISFIAIEAVFGFQTTG